MPALPNHNRFQGQSRVRPERFGVLIVDDQEPNLQVVATALAAEGFDIVLADSGQRAFERIDARSPDLILLDVMMPDLDGFQVCSRLKANPETADIPVIFLSAADETDTIVRALEAGGVDYVTKPFKTEELLSRVRTHLALKDTRDQLEKLLDERDEFIAILAHDLKNPLSGVRFSAQLLARMADDLPEKAQRLSATILDGSSRVFDFIERFLTEAHDARTEVTVERKPIDLATCVEEAVSRHLAPAARKNIVLHWEKPATPVLALADDSALEAVLDNLLSNALKFSHSGSAVWASATAVDGGRPLIRIRDEGQGFSKEDYEKIFQRFVRLSARPTAGESSTGLGLSITRRFVELMGGTIEMVSPPGKGAEFEISLPSS